MSAEATGFAAMCGAIEHEASAAERYLPLAIVGGVLVLIGANYYLKATGKLPPDPVYYGPGYYPAYYPVYEQRPGVTFNF